MHNQHQLHGTNDISFVVFDEPLLKIEVVNYNVTTYLLWPGSDTSQHFGFTKFTCKLSLIIIFKCKKIDILLCHENKITYDTNKKQ
jgi:hypothetical protein